jgi:hypothetical protein
MYGFVTEVTVRDNQQTGYTYLLDSESLEPESLFDETEPEEQIISAEHTGTILNIQDFLT